MERRRTNNSKRKSRQMNDVKIWGRGEKDEDGKQQGKFGKTKENKWLSQELRNNMQNRREDWMAAVAGKYWKRKQKYKHKTEKPEVYLLNSCIKQNNMFLEKIKRKYRRCLIKVWIKYYSFKISHDWILLWETVSNKPSLSIHKPFGMSWSW